MRVIGMVSLAGLILAGFSPPPSPRRAGAAQRHGSAASRRGPRRPLRDPSSEGFAENDATLPMAAAGTDGAGLCRHLAQSIRAVSRRRHRLLRLHRLRRRRPAPADGRPGSGGAGPDRGHGHAGRAGHYAAAAGGSRALCGPGGRRRALRSPTRRSRPSRSTSTPAPIPMSGASLNAGPDAAAGAVRTEEMLNYFRYDYPLPADRARPFSVSTDIDHDARGTRRRGSLRVGLRGYDLQRSERPAANLVFLIDVSGSMNEPDKLPLVQCVAHPARRPARAARPCRDRRLCRAPPGSCSSRPRAGDAGGSRRSKRLHAGGSTARRARASSSLMTSRGAISTRTASIASSSPPTATSTSASPTIRR